MNFGLAEVQLLRSSGMQWKMKHLCKSHSRTCWPRPGVDLGCRNFDSVSPQGGQVETGHFRAGGQWPSVTGNIFIWPPCTRILFCFVYLDVKKPMLNDLSLFPSSSVLKSPVLSLSDYSFSDSHQPALNCKWEVFVSAEWLVPARWFHFLCFSIHGTFRGQK